jgi:hypothetical protein
MHMPHAAQWNGAHVHVHVHVHVHMPHMHRATRVWICDAFKKLKAAMRLLAFSPAETSFEAHRTRRVSA